MKTMKSRISKTVALLALIGLASFLAGCASPKGGVIGGSSLDSPESRRSQEASSGAYDYREILSNPGPF